MSIMAEELDLAIKDLTEIKTWSKGENELSFVQRNYSTGLKKYIDRLLAIGFDGHNRILDAGCGFGQWSLALSQINKNVWACDGSRSRVEFLNKLLSRLNIQNIEPTKSYLEELPYENNYFDAVFCYGVIFITPWRDSLAELTRVLKPGGKIYLTANGLGWYLFLWREEHNKVSDYDPKAIAAQSFTDTLRYNRDNSFQAGMNFIIEPEEMKHQLIELGFVNIELDSEGTLHLNNTAVKPKPFFNGKYQNNVSAYEVVATKSN